MRGRSPSWFSQLSDTELAYLGGGTIAVVLLLAAIIVWAWRSCNKSQRRQYYDTEPARADEYDTLRVVVNARDQEAELEVQTDAWESYEELRELVVDAVPNLFRATDELTLEYQNASAKWVRVKMRTPVETVKAARGARITVAPAKSPARR